MKELLIAVLLVVGLLLVLFHGRVTTFQMEMYRRWLPVGGFSPALRVFYDVVVVLIGIGFVAGALGYLLGLLR